MNPSEYEIMADVEDVHWWYRGLRGLITMYMKQFAEGGKPRILDVGCGTGANISLMQQYGTVIGLDLSSAALRLSKSRDLHALVQGDASSLPYEDTSFDVVLLMDVLYHRDVPDKSIPLREVMRVLKSGGIVLLNVPAYPWLMSRHDLAVHTDQRFFRSSIRSLLEETGFTRSRTTYWNTLLFPIVVLVRMLQVGKDSDKSDLAGYRESATTSMLESILLFERVLLRRVSLPFGSSIFAVARKE